MSLTAHHYHLAADLRDLRSPSSSTTVRFASSTNVGSMNVGGIHLRSATLNGAAVDLESGSEGRLELTGLREENVVVLTGGIECLSGRTGGPIEERDCLAAGAEFVGGPTWFGYLTQSTAKPTVTVDVYCPPGWSVLGNGSAHQITPNRWRMASSRTVAPHLVCFTTGVLHSVRSEHDGISLAFHAPIASKAQLDAMAARLFAEVSACLDELHRHIGVRFAWRACDFVFIPSAPWLAMEYPGCVQLGERLLGARGSSTVERVVVLAHELAHMWFGNLVTPTDGEHVWLFEALAEYFGTWTAAAIIGEGRVGIASLSRRASAYAAAFHAPQVRLADDHLPLTRLSYVKGAAALADLRSRVGDDVFLDGLRRLLDRHRDGFAGVNDVLEHWVAAGADSIDEWRRQWLRGGGIASVWADVGDGRSSVDLSRSSRRTLSTDPSWERIRLTRDQWYAMPELIPLFDLAARATAWMALRLAVETGELSGTPCMEVVTSLLASEVNEHLLDVSATWTTNVLLWRYLRNADAKVADALSTIIAGARTSSELKSVAGRHWIDVADANPLRTIMSRLSGPTRWRATTRLAVLGVLTDREIDGINDRHHEADTRVLAARCRAAIPTRASKEQTWSMLMSYHSVSLDERIAAAKIFWHPRHHAVTAPFVARYFEALATRRPDTKMLLQHGFPYTGPPGMVHAGVHRLIEDPSAPAEVRVWAGERVADLRRHEWTSTAMP